MLQASARRILRVLSVAWLSAACSGPGDASASSSESAAGTRPVIEATRSAEVLGTIEATLDGDARTWYVVTGSVRGEAYASAVWFETAEGGLIASLGGYDTADLPFDTFETDPARGVSVGDYQGSAITVLLVPGGGVAAYGATISEDAPGVTYAPDAAVPGIDGVYFGRSGSLEVTKLEIVGDRLHVEGTFEGTLRQMGAEDEVQVTEGRFAVRGVPPRSALGGG